MFDDKVNLYAQDFSYYNDFDKDGKPDLITYGVEYGDSANQGERQKFGPTIWFNTTPNGYSTYTLLHDNAFYRKYQGFGKLNMTASMVIYDYDNDGYKDVILNNIKQLQGQPNVAGVDPDVSMPSSRLHHGPGPRRRRAAPCSRRRSARLAQRPRRHGGRPPAHAHRHRWLRS